MTCFHFFKILFQRNHYANVWRRYPKPSQIALMCPVPQSLVRRVIVVSLSDITMVTLSRSRSHSRASGSFRMGKGGISNYGYRRMKSSIGCSFRHGDRRSHVHTWVDGIERSVGTQCIASDITEYFVGRILFSEHFGQSGIHVAMAASLTESGRTHSTMAGTPNIDLFLAYGTRNRTGFTLRPVKEFRLNVLYVDAQS